MREAVEKILPTSPGFESDRDKTISIIQETYVQDAYHSLSIEGYQVTEELIEKMKKVYGILRTLKLIKSKKMQWPQKDTLKPLRLLSQA